MTWITLTKRVWDLIDSNTRGNIQWPLIRERIADLVVKTNLPVEEKKLALAVVSGRLEKIQADINKLNIV